MGALSSGVKQLRHEFHHCAPSNAKAKNEWSYNSIPICKFMLYRGAALLSNVGTFICFIKILKTCPPLISHPLSYILYHSLYTCIFPGHLKIAVVISLYKKGNKSSVTNYRPVSL
jgi:hypothetical protein